MNELDTGALGPSGRFARMEAALERIENKLDLKADVVRVVAVEARMTTLEQMITDAMTGKTTSALSQLYLTKFGEMEKAIEALERKDVSREAVLEVAKDRVDSRFRFLAAVFGAASAISMVISLYGAVN